MSEMKPRFVPLNDRAVLALAGPDARKFLQGLITNNIERLGDEKSIYAALLTPQGKFLFDFFLVQSENRILLDCRKDSVDALSKKLTLYKLRADLTIKDASDEFAIVAIVEADVDRLQVPADAERGHTWQISNGIAFIDPRHAGMGIRAYFESAKFAETCTNMGLEAAPEQNYTRHRLKIGVPEGGLDILPEKAFLLESNFDEMDGVDHKKGCYIGQETTSRTKRRGSVRRRLLPVDFPDSLPTPGSAIKAGDAEIGTVMSGLDKRAMASIRLDRWEKARHDSIVPTVDGQPVTINLPDWIVLQ